MIQETMTAVHVHRLPEEKDMEPGKIYIADEFQVAAHFCCCGCGERILMSIDPLGWKYTEEEGKPTFSPSIGNFGLPCKSHYFIRKGEVVWLK